MPSPSQRSIAGRCARQRAQPSPRGRPPAGCSASRTWRTSSSLTVAVTRTPALAAALRYRRTVFGSSPSWAAMRFFGSPSPRSRRTSLISIIVTSRYIHASWSRVVAQDWRPISRGQAKGGKGFEKLAPEGGKGFEKPHSRGGKGFEKVVRKGSLRFENRHTASLQTGHI